MDATRRVHAAFKALVHDQREVVWHVVVEGDTLDAAVGKVSEFGVFAGLSRSAKARSMQIVLRLALEIVAYAMPQSDRSGSATNGQLFDQQQYVQCGP